MPRKLLIRKSECPYHVTARANNQEWFHLPLVTCWEVFSEKLAVTQEKTRLIVHAFVLMSNHFHLLVTTPESNLDEAMNYFMRETSKEVGRRAGRKNHIFGGPYYWSLIEDPVYFAHAMKYALRNPVDAGIVRRVEAYPYSTAFPTDFRFHLDNNRTRFFRFIPDNAEERLMWLNDPFGILKRDLIRRALRRGVFRFTAQNDYKSLVAELSRS